MQACFVSPRNKEGVGHAYERYWLRKRLLDGLVPHFPIVRWWEAADLCQSEQIIFEEIQNSANLLDVGAGDLRVQRKLSNAGYRGEYHTQDIGSEFTYTFRDLPTSERCYGAVLCLDVLEHLVLEEGLALLERLESLLSPGGVLVLQTPNARCVRSPLAWDITHKHCYNLSDLWAHLQTMNLVVHGYRVLFSRARFNFWDRCRTSIQAFLITRVLGCDYTDNLLLFARLPEERARLQ